MDENQPVEDEEFVYRRIHQNFYDPKLTQAVLFEAFRPNKNDTTGLSVFRAQFAQPKDTLPADPAKAKDYYVARLAVQDLRKLGLTVVPEPQPNGPPGHAAIPEISYQAYQANKQSWKPILVELAKLASADIVHQPGNQNQQNP